MKKKIAADLTSLAHRVLQLKNKDDVTELQSIAKELYEKLTVLAFTEKHFADAQPSAGTSEIEERLDKAYAEAKDDVGEVSSRVEKVMEDAHEEAEEAFSNNDLSDLFVPADEDEREEMDLPGISTINKMVIEMPDELPETPEKKEGKSDSLSKVEQPTEDAFEKKAPEPQIEAEKNKDQANTEGSSDLKDLMPQQRYMKNDAEEISPDDFKEKNVPESWELLIKKVQSEQKTATKEDSKKDEAIEDPKEVTKPESKKSDFEEMTADFGNMPVFERKLNDNADRPKSLNERLNQGMKIGMNDRLGFVKHLFNGSTDDFNRVLSQLNTLPTLDKANQFIENMVKPDYNNWEGKDTYANKFRELVERNYS